MEQRKIRGYSILAKGDTPSIVDENNYLVPSQSTDKKYKVSHTEAWSCSCPDFQKRGLECKHIQAIKFWLKLKNKVEIEDLEITEEMYKRANELNITKIARW